MKGYYSIPSHCTPPPGRKRGVGEGGEGWGTPQSGAKENHSNHSRSLARKGRRRRAVLPEKEKKKEDSNGAGMAERPRRRRAVTAVCHPPRHNRGGKGEDTQPTQERQEGKRCATDGRAGREKGV